MAGNKGKSGNALFTPEIRTSADGTKKQVVGISIDGKACVFESSKDVERKLGIESRNVRGCCEGKRNLAGGLFFVWAENWNGTTELTENQKRKYEIAMKRKETKWKKTESAH